MQSKNKNNLLIGGVIILVIIWAFFFPHIKSRYESKTFLKKEFVSQGYTKDNDNVYFQWMIISWADAKTFRLASSRSYYGTDKTNKMYYKNQLLTWLTNNVHRLHNYVKDNRIVYFEWKEVKWADAVTFETIPNATMPAAKDMNNVFYKDQIISWADPKSIEAFIYNMLKDKNGVYVNWEKIPDCISSQVTWFVEQPLIFMCNNAVYQENKRINDVDVHSFKRTNWRDENWVYHFEDKNNTYSFQKDTDVIITKK